MPVKGKSNSRINEKLKQRDFKLNVLLEITSAINANFSVEEMLELYERVLREHLSIAKLVLFVKEEKWNCLLKYGLEKGEIEEQIDDSFFEQNGKITFAVGHSKEAFDIVIPILQNDMLVGHLLVGDDGEQEIRMSPVVKHIKFIQTLTYVLITAIQNKKLHEESIRQERINAELKLAAEMQAILLPNQLPSNEHYDVSAVYRAHQLVGGDYYDFIELNDNEVMFCMADVSGKGVSAAFLMANFQAYIRSIFFYRNGDLSDIVRELNDRIVETAKCEKYVTLFLAIYRKSTRMLNYVNCGHNPPVMVDSNGYVQMLQHGTIGIGMFEELPSIVEGEVRVTPQSIVVCYTDGLTETENNQQEAFGEERLKRLILSYFKDSMADLNDVILETVDEFREEEPYCDDLSILSCRFR